MGVMLGLLGSIAINLGNNMQSLGMGKDANVKRLEEESLRLLLLLPLLLPLLL